MTWSRFDDAARKHPKAVMAGNDAWGFWAAAIMYCNQYSTDGFVPDAALATELLPVPISKVKAKALADKCCAARLSSDGPGLFVRDERRRGYIVNDFLDWNPSKAETDSKRRKDRERKRGPVDGGPEGGGNPPPVPPGIRSDSARNPDGGAADSVRPTRVPAPAGPGARAEPARPAVPDPPAAAAATRGPCPRDLDAFVPAADYGNWAMVKGIPEPVARSLIQAYAAKYAATPSDVRFVDAWIRGAVTVVMQDGVAAARKALEAQAPKVDPEHAAMAARF